jgi:hypothetical protein
MNAALRTMPSATVGAPRIDPGTDACQRIVPLAASSAKNFAGGVCVATKSRPESSVGDDIDTGPPSCVRHCCVPVLTSNAMTLPAPVTTYSDPFPVTGDETTCSPIACDQRNCRFATVDELMPVCVG